MKAIVCDGCGVYLQPAHNLQVTVGLRTVARYSLCLRCLSEAEREIETALCCALGRRVPV